MIKQQLDEKIMAKHYEWKDRCEAKGISFDPAWAPGMTVINECHPDVNKSFDNTKWANGRWRQSLLTLKDAYRIDEPHITGGVEGTHIAIPMSYAPPEFALAILENFVVNVHEVASENQAK
ncbi:MAG: hypothetical protein M3N08_02870 [Pseudomonadota bacterium]|nr:hypothetical protein [Pseudomonadota bacterium]